MVKPNYLPNIAAAIITFQPVLHRLAENLRSIAPQVSAILLIDNGSSSFLELRSYCNTFSHLTLIANPKNLGIAAALNQAALWARDAGFDWLLTLDQDSVCPDDIIVNYRRYLDYPHLGLLCCRLVDRNVGELLQYPLCGVTQEVKTCITSASLLRITAWEMVGGFCEAMFIDVVDFDFCYRLREAGYVILRNNSILFNHEVGHADKKQYLGKTIYIFHHSPTRNYYLIRNTLYFGKRHHCFLSALLTTSKHILLISLFEHPRCAHLWAIIQGISHAIIGRYGVRPL